MKKISPVVLVGFALTLLWLSLYVCGLPFSEAISRYAYDAFLQRACESPKSDRVVIVDLDDASFARPGLGQWPWSRDKLADLTRKLFDAGASVVGFDIIFPEKDRTSPVVFKEKLENDYEFDVRLDGLSRELWDYDALFADALRTGKAILGCMMIPPAGKTADADTSLHRNYRDHVSLRKKPSAAGRANINDYLKQAQKLQISIPLLHAAAETAFFNADPDDDNIVRFIPLIYALGDSRVYPSFALEAVRLHLGVDRCFGSYDENGMEEMTLGNLTIPTDRHGQLIINYRKVFKDPDTRLHSSFPSYSAGDVLQGKVGKDVFAGKIALVGASAVGLRDLKATPITSDFPGVQIHATMIDNMLAGDMLRMPSWLAGANVLAILLVGILVTVVIHKGKSWLSFLVSIAIVLVAIWASFVLMQRTSVVFVPVWEIISVAMIYPVLTMLKFWEEERQRRKVRKMFGTMVSPKVLQYLERNPKSFSLSGCRTEATVFFSDIADFASISENLRPERVSELLNRYFTPMTQIILDRDGYADKYEGDLIMAEWGVPSARIDHAAQACLAALEQQERLAELRPSLKNEFGYDIHVRMGINSGIVTAGNMGSERHFEYTVLGDAVNLAARFEPANKDYRTLIIIGENTYQATKDVIEARLLDKIVVKGISRPVDIYELLARKGQLSPAKRKVVELYEEALRLHRERKWDGAADLFMKGMEMDPLDGPCSTMLQRVTLYKQNPPPDAWQGEHVRAAKD